MNILFFTKGDASVASSRQRVWFMLTHLEALGHKGRILHALQYPLLSFSRKRFQVWRNVYSALKKNDYDIIFVHKSLYPWDIVILVFVMRWLYRKPLMYDLDDAEWVHSPAKTRLFVYFADTIFCGSHEIMRWVERRSSRRTMLVPTVLDYAVYASYRESAASSDICTIGWTGAGARHFKDGIFGPVRDILSTLSHMDIRLRFVVLGAEKCQLLKEYFSEAPFETVFVDELLWSNPSSVPQAMHDYAFDIGIMPQSDTVFNRAKCSFKAIEYMAYGIPCIASRVGENPILIEDGVNGFLADTHDEWVTKLKNLCDDRALRERMGREAARTIQDKYSYEAMVPIVARSMEMLLSKK